MHGLVSSSATWVLNLPHQSAGFIFADAGFDVWLGNIRGNTYGRKHVILNDKQKEFWRFSWSEHAHNDLPAIFDKIEEVTNQSQIYYLGYSQGSTMMFAQLAEHPEFANRIKRFFALGPAVSMRNTKGFLRFMADVMYPIYKKVRAMFGDSEFVPKSYIMDWVVRHVCRGPMTHLCSNFIFLLAGPEMGNINETRINVYSSHTPAGTSNQNILHWAQLAYTGVFAKFDYIDKEKNVEHYKQETPPLYSLNNIDQNLKIHFYTSKTDILADPADVKDTISKLPKGVLKSHKILDKFSHLDFQWGLNAPKLVYYPILHTIKKLDQV
ncbi:unnamed protein product [Bursaphelenchus xylophilus]|nr:unnamed protein product [Bursaphelenchus xylophilus]CAG9117119.1 unnamed protein product [Bursaphelenchus xylophilus]